MMRFTMPSGIADWPSKTAPPPQPIMRAMKIIGLSFLPLIFPLNFPSFSDLPFLMLGLPVTLLTKPAGLASLFLSWLTGLEPFARVLPPAEAPFSELRKVLAPDKPVFGPNLSFAEAKKSGRSIPL